MKKLVCLLVVAALGKEDGACFLHTGPKAAYEKRSQNNSEAVFLFFGGRVFPDLPDPYPVFGGYVEFVAGLDVEGIVPVVALGEGSVDAQTVD